MTLKREELVALRDAWRDAAEIENDRADFGDPVRAETNGEASDDLDALLARWPEGHELRPREPTGEMAFAEQRIESRDPRDIWIAMFDGYSGG